MRQRILNTEAYKHLRDHLGFEHLMDVVRWLDSLEPEEMREWIDMAKEEIWRKK